MLYLTLNFVPWFAAFIILVSLSVFISLKKDKDKITKILLAYLWVLTFTLVLGFCIQNSLYSPTILHVSSIINLVALIFPIFTYFAYSFHGNHHIKESRVVLTIEVVLTIVFYTHDIWMSNTAKLIFDFEVHILNYIKEKSFLAPLFLLESLWLILIFMRKSILFDQGNKPSIFRIFHLRGQKSKSLRAFGIIAFNNIIGACLFILYKQSIISKETYVFLQPINSLLTAAFIVYVFVNNSSKPTTFMIKLVGLSLVTVVLTTTFTGRFVFSQEETNFDKRLKQNIIISILQIDNQTNKSKLLYLTKKVNGKILTLKKNKGTILKPKKMLAPKKLNSRFYRSTNKHDFNNFYVAMQVKYKNVIYEGGISYVDYRKHMHRISLQWSLILLSVTFFILFFFPLFFRTSLVNPLNRLIDAVKKVEGGQYDVKTEVRVEDEIGTLTRSFNQMTSTIFSHTEELESKVENRTLELQESLMDIQELKMQQDGDYFLTSLLIAPLIGNRASSNNIKIDTYIKQKKNFKFRNWKRELGGDFCLSDDIILRKKKYVFFVNADAMGKSIQGAGGVLVIGATIQALIERSRFQKEVFEDYPERWLKNAFVELNKVFLSFDGQMMVSMMMGLVEEDSGTLYYINAEHPKSVLMRNGRASFLESDYHFWKLGHPEEPDTFKIETFDLKPKDKIVLGSDGRDDIDLGLGKSKRIINEDEYIFVNLVREKKAKLEDIVLEILKKGDLTDDLSLMSIEFRHAKIKLQTKKPQKFFKTNKVSIEELENYFNEKPNSLWTLNKLISLYGEEGNKSKVLFYRLKLFELYPLNLDNINICIDLNFDLGNHDHASDLAEIVKLRNPSNEHVRTKINVSNTI